MTLRISDCGPDTKNCGLCTVIDLNIERSEILINSNETKTKRNIISKKQSVRCIKLSFIYYDVSYVWFGIAAADQENWL